MNTHEDDVCAYQGPLLHSPPRRPPVLICEYTSYLQECRRPFREFLERMPPLYHTMPGAEFAEQDSQVLQFIADLFPTLLPCLEEASPRLKLHDASSIFRKFISKSGAVVIYNQETGKWEGSKFGMPDPLDPGQLEELEKKKPTAAPRGGRGFWKLRRQISREREPIYIALSKMEAKTKQATLNFIADMVKEHTPQNATTAADLRSTTFNIFRSVTSRRLREIVFIPKSRKYEGTGRHHSIDTIIERIKVERMERNALKRAARKKPRSTKKNKPMKFIKKPAKTKPLPTQMPPATLPTPSHLTPSFVASCIPKGGLKLPEIVTIAWKATKANKKTIHSAFRKAEQQKLVRMDGMLWYRVKPDCTLSC